MKTPPPQPTSDRYKIVLSRNDLGQMLDGLRCRAEAWCNTADYLETGRSSDSFFICEECSDSEEARSIARDYERIIAEIESQIAKQDARIQRG